MYLHCEIDACHLDMRSYYAHDVHRRLFKSAYFVHVYQQFHDWVAQGAFGLVGWSKDVNTTQNPL